MSLATITKIVITLLCQILRVFSKRKPTTGTFLIVEDDKEDAEILQDKIQKAGWNAEIAKTAEVAEGLVRHGFYPAIFIDMRLPGMPGEALMRIVSKNAPNTRCIIVCGEPFDLYKIPEGELVFFIRKPVTLEAVETILKSIKISHDKQ